RRHTRSYGDWSSDVCSSDLDEVVGEHTADLQELVVGFECEQGSVERTRNLRDLRQFLRRQVVQVLVHGRRRLDAVVDAVEARLRSEERRVGKECRARGWRWW